MKHTLPLSLVAAVACAGIAVASINPDTGYHSSAAGSLQAYSPVIDAELPVEAFAVNALMADPGMQSLDDTFCDEHANMTRDLARNFGEARQNADNDSIEVWASAEFGTWTVLEIQDNGLACVASSGIGWTDTSTPHETLQLAGLL